LLINDPRSAYRWIGDVAEVLAERAVLVCSDRSGNEQPVRVCELLAREAADCFVVSVGRAHRKAGAGATERTRPAKKAGTERLRPLDQLLGERESGARCRLDLAERAPVRGQSSVRRVIVH